jgi:hypothetical protein
MDRDFESKKHRYSAKSYLKVLDAEIKLIFEELDKGYIFMQDNAFIHKAYIITAWFAARGITIITNWPPYCEEP